MEGGPGGWPAAGAAGESASYVKYRNSPESLAQRMAEQKRYIHPEYDNIQGNARARWDIGAGIIGGFFVVPAVATGAATAATATTEAAGTLWTATKGLFLKNALKINQGGLLFTELVGVEGSVAAGAGAAAGVKVAAKAVDGATDGVKALIRPNGAADDVARALNPRPAEGPTNSARAAAAAARVGDEVPASSARDIARITESLDNTGRLPAEYSRRGYLQGGKPFKDKDGDLPSPVGRWREADVGDVRVGSGGTRGSERIVYDDAGNVWYTPDHYRSWIPVRTGRTE